MRKLRSLPLADWPVNDQAAWVALFESPVRLFGDSGRGRHLRPCTRTNYARSNGLWLAHLVAVGELDSDFPPAARPTPMRLDGWVGAMKDAGRTDSTIALYLTALYSLLRLFDPSADLAFIIKPRGLPLSRLLPSRPKPFPPLDTEDVMRKALVLHQDGLVSTSVQKRRTALRDAALLGLFVRRGPRLSSVAAMRIGEHLKRNQSGDFMCEFAGPDSKSGKRIAWPLDRDCGMLMQHYLDQGRPWFEPAAPTDALWLGNDGAPLNGRRIADIFRRYMRDWFSLDVGPHVARKWVRSTAARRPPGAAFDAAEVLGHSPKVSVCHYGEAIEVGATLRHADRLQALRRKTAPLARRLYQMHEEDGSDI